MANRRRGRKKIKPLPDPMDWGREQSVMTRHLARSTAVASGDIAVFFHNLRTGNLVKALPVPSVMTWMRYYRRHRLWENELSDLFCPRDESESPNDPRPSEVFRQIKATLRNLGQAVKEFQQMPDREREAAITGACEFWRDLAKLDDEVFAAALTGRDVENTGTTEGISLVQAPAFVFILRVFLPCILLHKDYPGRLLARARNGNVRALEQLLSVDKSVLFEPRLAALAHRWAQHEPARYRQFIARPLNRASPLMRRTRIMESLSGLVSIIAAVSASGGITAPRLLELFDGVHKAKTGEPSDPDLPEKTSAFPKAIQRHRHEWEHNLGLKTPGQK